MTFYRCQAAWDTFHMHIHKSWPRLRTWSRDPEGWAEVDSGECVAWLTPELNYRHWHWQDEHKSEKFWHYLSAWETPQKGWGNKEYLGVGGKTHYWDFSPSHLSTRLSRHKVLRRIFRIKLSISLVPRSKWVLKQLGEEGNYCQKLHHIVWLLRQETLNYVRTLHRTYDVVPKEQRGPPVHTLELLEPTLKAYMQILLLRCGELKQGSSRLWSPLFLVKQEHQRTDLQATSPQRLEMPRECAISTWNCLRRHSSSWIILILF